MKFRSISLLSASVLLAFSVLAASVAPASAISVADQRIVDRAVARLEARLENAGPGARVRYVEALKRLMVLYPRDQRVQQLMPRIIYYVANPTATTFPAGATIPSNVFPVVSTGSTVVIATGTTSTGVTATGTTSTGVLSATGALYCGRPAITTSTGACVTETIPEVYSATYLTGSFSTGVQDLYSFTIRAPANTYVSLKRVVLKIDGTIGGRLLDTATFSDSGRSNTYDNIITAGGDSNLSLSSFSLLIDGQNPDGANGFQYYAVKRDGGLYLVVTMDRRIVISPRQSVSFLLKAKLTTASRGDSLRIGIPTLATMYVLDTPTVVGAGVQGNHPGLASILWSTQKSASHSDASNDYENDWTLGQTIPGYLTLPQTFLAQ